jgi:hypothetical protein
MGSLGVRPFYEGVLMYSTGRKSFFISFPVILNTYLRIPPPVIKGKKTEMPVCQQEILLDNVSSRYTRNSLLVLYV